MHSKYWIWVSEGKRSKSWKWPAPFFQEGLAQTGLFQSFRTELLLYDERTLSLKCNHLENTWSSLPSGVQSFSWLCTKNPPSFSVWRWDELPNILHGFLLGSAYTGSLLSLGWGQPSISSLEHREEKTPHSPECCFLSLSCVPSPTPSTDQIEMESSISTDRGRGSIAVPCTA